MRCLVGVFGLGVLLLFLGACTRPSTLQVTVTGMPAQSVSLAVSLAVQPQGDGPVVALQGLDPYALPQPAARKTSFVLRLPLQDDATLLLGVAAFSQAGGSGCLLGLGSVSHPYRTSILDDAVEVVLLPQSEDAQTGCKGSARIVTASPTVLTAGGGETLQVVGWGFVPGARIVLNGVPLDTHYVSAGQLEATTPPSARLTPVPLTVELPGGESVSYQGLRYITKTLSFSPLPAWSFADLYTYIEVADLDGDKRPDLIFYGDAYSGTTQIVIAFQSAPLQFTVQQIPVATSLVGLAVCDIDGDGDLDLITASADDQLLYVLKNDGHGSFTSKTYSLGMGITQLISLHTADINGDGAPDVLLNNDAATLYTYPNDGLGGFSSANRQTTTLTQGYQSTDVISLDYDLDGHPDIVLLGGGVLTVFSHPGPVLPADDSAALIVELPFYSAGEYKVADMDGDGITDLVMVDDIATPYILPSTSTPPRDAVAVVAACPTYTIATGDVNNDGQVDLATACDGEDNVLFALQSASHDFSVSAQQVTFPDNTQYWAARLVDLDGDGQQDLVVLAGQGLLTSVLEAHIYRNVSQ